MSRWKSLSAACRQPLQLRRPIRSWRLNGLPPTHRSQRNEQNADQEKAADQPAQQETASIPAATETRPPKLKPKANPAATGAASAAAPASSGTASPQDKASPAAPSSPAIEIKLPGQDVPVEIAAAP